MNTITRRTYETAINHPEITAIVISTITYIALRALTFQTTDMNEILFGDPRDIKIDVFQPLAPFKMFLGSIAMIASLSVPSILYMLLQPNLKYIQLSEKLKNQAVDSDKEIKSVNLSDDNKNLAKILDMTIEKSLIFRIQKDNIVMAEDFFDRLYLATENQIENENPLNGKLWIKAIQNLVKWDINLLGSSAGYHIINLSNKSIEKTINKLVNFQFQSQSQFFENLPETGVVSHIFSLLSSEELAKLKITSKWLHNFIDKDISLTTQYVLGKSRFGGLIDSLLQAIEKEMDENIPLDGMKDLLKQLIIIAQVQSNVITNTKKTIESACRILNALNDNDVEKARYAEDITGLQNHLGIV